MPCCRAPTLGSTAATAATANTTMNNPPRMSLALISHLHPLLKTCRRTPRDISLHCEEILYDRRSVPQHRPLVGHGRGLIGTQWIGRQRVARGGVGARPRPAAHLSKLAAAAAPEKLVGLSE